MKINCFITSEKPQQTQEHAKQLISLDNVIVDTAIAWPDGVKTEWINYHKLGDYFDTIQILPENSTTFKLVFQVKSNAKRYWKDLVVKTITSLRDSGASVKIGRSECGEKMFNTAELAFLLDLVIESRENVEDLPSYKMFNQYKDQQKMLTELEAKLRESLGVEQK